MDDRQSKTVNLSITERNLWMIRAALREYLATFSHNEGALVEEIKSLLGRLPAVEGSEETAKQVSPEGNRLTL